MWLGLFVENIGNYNPNNLILNFDRIENNLYFHLSNSCLVDMSIFNSTFHCHDPYWFQYLISISEICHSPCSEPSTTKYVYDIEKLVTCMDWTGVTCIDRHICKILLIVKCVDSCAKTLIYMPNHAIHTPSLSTDGISLRPKVVYVCIAILNQLYLVKCNICGMYPSAKY